MKKKKKKKKKGKMTNLWFANQIFPEICTGFYFTRALKFPQFLFNQVKCL